jgi:NADH:ubiquinone oxidoreductase subunit 5 (subunit L)/multisubunit Na+/H+ antiporter MnhA subunit
MNAVMHHDSLRIWTLSIIAVPLATLILLSAQMIMHRTWKERTIERLVVLGLSLAFILESALTLLWFGSGLTSQEVMFGSWFGIPGYTFVTTALIDALSLSMLVVTSFIALVVAAFSSRYLHREPGYARFFLLVMVFVLGMHVLVLAGSYDLLFVGWELVGLSSFLLIAFFHHRSGPVRGAIRAMVTYRASDVGLLVAGVLLHDAAGSSRFADAFRGTWPNAAAHLSSESATIIALCLLAAVIGKSAQWPLGGWLPRAMEGPTPSSALFYGALSVHTGVYLLLRSAPLFVQSATASAAAIVIGLITAFAATAAHRVQSDIKNALAYATMTQIGLMLVGVGLHLFDWTLVYMIAHTFLRLFQMLRAPSALRDAHDMHAVLSIAPKARPPVLIRILPERWQRLAYYVSLHRHFADMLIERFVVFPLLALSHRLDGAERRWTDSLGGIARDEFKDERPSHTAHSLPEETRKAC